MFTQQQIENGWELIDALRSDEFAQANGHLRVEELYGPKHCCLGVAAELQRRKNPEAMAWEESAGDFPQFVVAGALSSSYWLPEPLRDLYGFNDGQGSFEDLEFIEISGREYGSLSEANDEGEGFARIAYALEGIYGPRP